MSGKDMIASMEMVGLVVHRILNHLTIMEIAMRFDTWLRVMHKLSWELYLSLSEETQTKLADEYEASMQGWH